MKNILIGFIFIFLDIDINMGNSSIGLFPDFVGYYITVTGLLEMSDESDQFLKAKPWAHAMGIYTSILYFLDLLGISTVLGLLSFVLVIPSIVISLYISFTIIKGVGEIETKYNTYLNVDNLKSIWGLLTIFRCMSFLLLLIPSVAIICVIISIIVTICFLVAFNKSKYMYYEMNAL